MLTIKNDKLRNYRCSTQHAIYPFMTKLNNSGLLSKFY